jgi:hypothetical protein
MPIILVGMSGKGLLPCWKTGAELEGLNQRGSLASNRFYVLFTASVQ